MLAPMVIRAKNAAVADAVVAAGASVAMKINAPDRVRERDPSRTLTTTAKTSSMNPTKPAITRMATVAT